MPEAARTPALSVLRRAPGRLSTHAVERALGLPSGAWQRRRLYALRARSGAFHDIGILKGDSLVVEPGERLRPTQLVVVKESGRVSVRLCESLGTNGKLPIGQAALLPFLKIRTRVVGTVVGILRRDDHRQLRAVPFPDPGRDPHPATSATGKQERQRSQRLQQTDEFERRLCQWGRWVEHHSEEFQAIPGVSAISDSLDAYCNNLDKRLATLLECMRQARGDRLYSALSAEALSVTKNMDEVCRYLRRSNARRIHAARLHLARRSPHFGPSPRCGTPPAAGAVRIPLDTTRAGMV